MILTHHGYESAAETERFTLVERALLRTLSAGSNRFWISQSHKNLPRLTVPVFIESTENPLAMAQNAGDCSVLHRTEACAANAQLRRFPEDRIPPGEGCNLNW